MYQDPKNSTLLFPSDTDYRIRAERAQAAMKQAGVDVLAISGFDYLRFFTGLNGCQSADRSGWCCCSRADPPSSLPAVRRRKSELDATPRWLPNGSNGKSRYRRP